MLELANTKPRCFLHFQTKILDILPHGATVFQVVYKIYSIISLKTLLIDMIFPHFALVKATFYAEPHHRILSGRIIKIDEIVEQQETNYNIFRNKTETTLNNTAYLTFSVCGEEILRFAKFVFDQDETFLKDVYPEFFQELTN